MKRNRNTVRERRLKNSSGKSRYAEKLAGGRQMYGGKGADSCCAHAVKTRGVAGEGG